jgi:hypothetical protein
MICDNLKAEITCHSMAHEMVAPNPEHSSFGQLASAAPVLSVPGVVGVRIIGTSVQSHLIVLVYTKSSHWPTLTTGTTVPVFPAQVNLDLQIGKTWQLFEHKFRAEFVGNFEPRRISQPTPTLATQ